MARAYMFSVNPNTPPEMHIQPDEEATEDASRASVEFVAENTGLNREEAYMLLDLVGEPGIGTSPRPMMAARLMIPRQVLGDAGFAGL